MARVLVAEDDPDIGLLLRFKLEQAGIDVVVVANATAAVDAAREQVPDLFLLDVGLPGRSGLELCADLRADPTTRAVPIVLLSGGAHDWEIARGLAAGADEYLVKPISPQALLDRVQALIPGSA
ncbi:response regulator [Actinosynnema sp. NPDC020468]|uniref:response regulator transcription factor n=1 Tax=Actinosynnema sp. NPDC020468 TaxID=3154488 RepID=UPI0034080B46